MRNVLVLSLIVILAACSSKPTCKNTDVVFDQYSPNDQPYKVELLQQVHNTDANKIHYYVGDYKEIAGKPFMTVHVQAQTFCAQMIISIKNPNKMRDYKNVKGISYSGVEITGLQYHVDTINGQLGFTFEEGNINGKKQ